MRNTREPRPHELPRLASLLTGVLVLIALGSCVTAPVRDFEPRTAERPVVDARMTIRTLGADRRFSQLPAALVVSRLRARRGATPTNVLALSGGGSGGAFGAGALAGLTRSGARPEFALVTGVSAGALVAPYAFLGPDWDDALIEAYTGGEADHLLRPRGLGALWGSSEYSGEPLRELVDRNVSDAMIRAVAREAARGRLLLVATTDVDSVQPVFWDLGSIALHGGSSARTLFRDVLVASASVPGLFPPVVLHIEGLGEPHDEAHVDGGATVPFFVPPGLANPASEAPARVGHRVGNRGPAVYVLIDGRLGEAPRPTPLRARAIFERSVAAGLYRMLRTTLELTAATARMEGAVLRYSAIPLDYPGLDEFDFRARTMSSLFHYAYQCAASGNLWVVSPGRPEENPPILRGDAASPSSCPADEGFLGQFAGP